MCSFCVWRGSVCLATLLGLCLFKLSFANSGPAQFSASLFVGVLALFGDRLRAKWFKPSLHFLDVIKMNQEEEGKILIFYRLHIKNRGDSPAKEVRVQMSFRKCGQSESAKGPISIPLRWTHISEATRDISCDEEADLDVLCKEGDSHYYCWPYHRTSDQDLSGPGKNNDYLFELSFFERNRKLQKATLRFHSKDERLELL